jgi:hypothetical protein
MTRGRDAIAGLARRTFLHVGGVAGAGLFLPVTMTAESQAGARGGASQKGGKQEKEEEEVSPPEDLMREHGVLKRVLLVYEEAIRRIDAKQDLPPDPVRNAANIIRTSLRTTTRSSKRIICSRASRRLVGSPA